MYTTERDANLIFLNFVLFSFIASSCPTSSDPKYKMISGTCYYFETANYDHSDAQENCRNRFGPASTGGLFEPQSKAINDAVHVKAVTFSEIQSGTSLWLGITSLNGTHGK